MNDEIVAEHGSDNLADDTDEFLLDLESDSDKTHSAENGEELTYFMILKEISGWYIV